MPVDDFTFEGASGSVRCIVGLGNPGSEYRFTRHNAGYSVIASLAEVQKTSMHEGNGDYFLAECQIADQLFMLVAPTVFMNESGIAVVQVMEQFALNVEELLIVLDDFQLPLGTLRIRAQGTDGGHNGLASVIYQVQSDKIARLRFGIAGSSCPVEDRKDLMADYVLSPFNDDERAIAETMVGHARDSVLDILQGGLTNAMNRFNRSFLGDSPAAK